MRTYLPSLRLMAFIALICGLPLRGGSIAPGGGCFEGSANMVGVLADEFGVPNCGPFTLGVVMRFRMIDKQTNSFFYIAVVILCPNIYGKKFFKAGNKYRITCKGKVESGIKKYDDYLIINKYANQNLPTYMADRVVLLE